MSHWAKLPIHRALEQASRPPPDSHGLDELNRALEQVGVANPSALEANRQGRLTSDQRGALLRDLRSNLLWAILVLAAGAVLVYLGFSKKDFTGMLAISAFFVLIELAMWSQVRSDLSDWPGGAR